jgi:outer membrane receptor protein involved in Fe transport
MHRGLWITPTVTAALLLAGGAIAQDQPAPAPEPESWIGSIKVGGDIEFGATLNPASPDNGVNYGQLFTDKANQVVLNQFALFAGRDPDPAAGVVDFGFKVGGMYGMDSQFTHFLGIGDQGSTGRNSFDLLEANIDAHASVLTPGGVDVKAGMFETPMGGEVIDPSGNFFYSNSYIFNFGLPRKHTGLLTTVHVNSLLDVYLGATTGVNASIGPGGGYNDGRFHFLGGFGLNLQSLTVRAWTHIGPEDPRGSLPPGVDIHDALRYLNDVTITWKVNDRLTSMTELNYIKDDGLRAEAGGASETLTYPLSAVVSAGLRAEIWRDAQGAFVAGYPGNLDYVDVEEGAPNTAYRAGPATYSEFTFGLNFKPAHALSKIHALADGPFDGLTVRPEVRYDRVLAGGPAFDGRPGTARDQVTVALDVIIPLSFQHAAQHATMTSDGGGEGAALPAQAATEAMATARPAAKDARDTPPEATVIVPGQPGVPRLESLEDLNGLAPNVEVTRVPTGEAVSALTIRGLGYASPGLELNPAVGLVVDDVVIGTSYGRLVDVFDVARIGIEPGPSGPLSGPDALGGMVDVQRAKPTRQWGLDLDYSLEQGYHANTEKVLFNMPVGANAGLAIDVSHDKRGGYFNNIYTGDGLYGGDELTTGNLRFDWNITPKLEVDLSLTLTHEDGQGTPLALGDTLAARLLGPALTAAMPGPRFNAQGSPYLPGVTVPLGPWQVASDYADQNKLTAQVYSLGLAYDTAIGRFTSTTAFMRQNDETGQDLSGGCAVSDLGGAPCDVLANPLTGFLHTDNYRKYDQFSEELRFTHDFGDWARLLAGLYYRHDDLSTVALTETAEAGVPATAPLTNQISDETEDSGSVFANLVVSPTRRLRIGAGLRYVDDGVDFRDAVNQTYIPYVGPGYEPLASAAGTRPSRKVLTKFTADYSLTDNNLLYADRSVGFRPGGLAPGATLSEQIPGQSNYSASNPKANYSAFNPETDTSYEIGSKNTLLNNQLEVNIAGFIIDDSDYQFEQLVVTPGYGPGFNSYVVNLPKVEIKGAELAVDYRPAPIRGLTLTGVGAYEDARITNGLIPGAEAAANANATAGAPGTTFNLTGAPLDRTPAFSFTLRGDYALRLGPGVVDFNVGYRWTDRYSLGELAGQGDYQPAFGLLDMSLGYSRSFYEIILTARNLTNQIYLSNALPALFVHGWGDPRTAVVELRAKF